MTKTGCWTTLYVLMAVSGWLVWRKAWTVIGPPLAWFWGQLVLNAAWSFVFFGFQQPGWAFGEIVLLWLSIAATVWAFWSVSGLAALLLAPYLGWVSFAACLNFTIWRMNQ